MNRTAVALAADSAVTIGKERVWKHSNKLFSLSSGNDIGIMIYNAGDHCGVPWGIIIKRFRKHVGSAVFITLEDCVKEFCNFLKNFELPKADLADLNLYTIFITSVQECLKYANEGVNGQVDKRRRFVKHAKKLTSRVKKTPIELAECNLLDFSEAYDNQIESFLTAVKGFSINSDMKAAIKELCFERARRRHESEYDTGVVFAGYGEAQVFPALIELRVDGSCMTYPRFWVRQDSDLNKDHSARVVPFGQRDITALVMEGIQPDYRNFILQTIEGTLKEKSRRIVKDYVSSADRVVETAKQATENRALVREFDEVFHKFRQEHSIQPMMQTVMSLPKEEMAAMAEALVEITSLRRKIDSRLETVGGPVDVALISKADGFVWIKRKHYFDIDLNRDFLERRSTRYEGG